MFGGIEGGGNEIRNLLSIANWNLEKVKNNEGMFWDCALEDATGMKNWKITKIDGHMFNDCLKLKSIIIPASVTTIAENAFENCTSLSKIKILTIDAENINYTNAFLTIDQNSKIYVLSEEIKAKLEGSYDTTKTTIEVVTQEQMNQI